MIDAFKGKKICIAIHGLSHAGAERVAASWASYLAKQGHDVFVTMYGRSEITYDLDTNVRVLPIADDREAYFQMPIFKKLQAIRKIIKREKPEILLSFLPKMQITMMLATWGMKIKRIETVRNNPWTDTDVAGKRFLWNLCFHRSDAIVVQTKEQAQYFPQKLQKKIAVISNPVSKDLADQQKIYQDAGIRKFVSVARINQQKNYPMMIRAFAKAIAQNPRCRLDIYGTGEPEMVHQLQELIDRLGMDQNITLCGWRKDVTAMLPGYDAFLMSSNYEGMPNALAEAMTTGLVCLSTDCKTGPKDMIDHGINGYLAETGNEESFEEGIRKIMQMDLAQCTAMGAAAREKILAMCSEENTLVRLNQLIENM